MKLHFQHLPGPGSAVLILHGLFGSSRNWMTHAKELSAGHDVFVLDHRNHGDSPWNDEHSLRSLIADALELQETEIRRPALWLGHSMGGLVAMGAALLQPRAVSALVVADIAPRPYAPHHDREFAALHLDVEHLATRQQVDEAMATLHADASVRQFLQMNLERQGNGFRWKLNVNALERAEYLSEFDGFAGLEYDGPTLFLAGSQSPYVTLDDHGIIREFFPRAEIRVIEGDHWLHHTNYRGFMEELRRFADD